MPALTPCQLWVVFSPSSSSSLKLTLKLENQKGAKQNIVTKVRFKLLFLWLIMGRPQLMLPISFTHIQPPGLSDLLAKLCSMSQGHTSDKKVTKALHSLFSVFFFLNQLPLDIIIAPRISAFKSRLKVHPLFSCLSSPLVVPVHLLLCL